MTEGCRMAFSPSEAPLYGGLTLHVAFSENSLISADSELYCVFDGSRLRHISQGIRVNGLTLQTAIPGHDVPEGVALSVISYQDNQQRTLATSTFRYVLDSTHFMAEYLLNSVSDHGSLEDLELIRSDQFDLADEDLSTLDERLLCAFEHLEIPKEWNILGKDSEQEPRETLLHFSARLGLTQFATFLLDKPGAHEAIRLPNREDRRPSDIARELSMDDTHLAELLTDYNPSLGQWDSSNKVRTDDSIKLKRNKDNSVTLTRKSGQGVGIDEDLAVLREFNILLSTDENQATSDRDGPSSPSYPQYTEFNQATSDRDGPSSPSYPQYTEFPIDECATEERQDSLEDDEISQMPPESILVYNCQSALQGMSSTNYGREESCESGALLTSPSMVSGVFDGQAPPSGILEENIRRLNDITDSVKRLQQANQDQARIRDERRESLNRFSTSCPVLAESDVASPEGSASDDTDHYKSMLDITGESNIIAEEDDDDIDTYNYENNIDTFDPVVYSGTNSTQPGAMKIQLNDVTLDDSDDHVLEEGCILGYSENRKPRSRTTGGLVGASKERMKFRDKMMAVGGRSMSLSSLDSQEEDRNEDNVVRYHDDSPSFHEQISQSRNALTDSPESGSSDLNPSKNGRSSVCSTNDIDFELQPSPESQDIDPEVKRYSMPPQHASPSRYNGRKASHHGGFKPVQSLTKSVSTPSIPNIKELQNEEDKENEGRVPSPLSKTQSVNVDQSAVRLRKKDHSSPHLQDDSPKSRVSMIEFLTDPSNFEEDPPTRRPLRVSHDGSHGVKDEKKSKRSSMFSFSSKRGKKKKVPTATLR